MATLYKKVFELNEYFKLKNYVQNYNLENFMYKKYLQYYKTVKTFNSQIKITKNG